MKIVTVVGARPQFVKAAVISRAVSNMNNSGLLREQIQEKIIHTGQHYDRDMSDVFFEEMFIPKPDYFLNVNGMSHGAMTGQMLAKIERALVEESPDCVLVYGDTNSTLAGALAAAKLNIPVAHVESGLRSYNRQMPEETNRVMTDHISSFLFCPTEQAVRNLKGEGLVNDDRRHVVNTGDVMLDAVHFYKKEMKKPGVGLPGEFILSTLHRAENTDDPQRLQSIFDAFATISKDKQIVIPVHPRTEKILSSQRINVCRHGILMISPVSYYEMLYLLDKCSMVMTDSGGLQKEAFFFRKPCITLRTETEWVELVDHGFNCIAGTNSDSIVNVYGRMEDKPIGYENLYGDGDSGGKIVRCLVS